MTDLQTPLDDPLPRSPWHWRRWVLLILGLSVASLVAVVVFQRVQARNRLQAILADLDATDPRWRLRDIDADRAEVPDAENSALLIATAGKLLPRGWEDTFPALDAHLLRLPPQQRLPEEDKNKVRLAVAAALPALHAAVPLAERPRGRHPIQYHRIIIATNYHTQPLVVPLGQAFRLAAIERAEEGAISEALRHCHAALNAARSIGDEPVAITQLIRQRTAQSTCRAIERVLAHGVARAEELKRLEEALLEEDRFDGLLLTTRAERGSAYLMFDVLESGEVPVSAMLEGPMDWKERYFGPVVRSTVAPQRSLFLELMNRRVAEVRVPLHEQVALERAFAADVDKLKKSAELTHALMLSYVKISPKFRAKHAHLRSLATLLAVERYRLQTGEWPDQLERLAPGYLREIPLSPGNGLPVRFSWKQDGVEVWSVSDGGNVAFRLWDVGKRGQPPPPKAENPE